MDSYLQIKWLNIKIILTDDLSTFDAEFAHFTNANNLINN